MNTRQQKLKQQAMRREQRKRQSQQRFTEPLTGPRAQKVAKAQTNMAYGETDRQIRGQIKASGQQQKKVGDWYNQFANEIAASRGEVAAAYGQANTAIAGNIAQAGADDTARQAAVSAQDAEFAKMTGGPLNTAGAQTSAAAAQQRQLYGANLAAPVATQGANAFAYLTNQRNTAKGEGINQKIAERKRRLTMQSDRKALLKEKGQYRVSKLNELRQGERDYGIQRAAFKLDKQGQALDAADDAFDNNIAARNANTSAGNLAQREREENYDRSQDRNQDKGNGNREGRRNANAAAQSLFEKRKWPSWAALETQLRKEAEIGPAEARAAVKRLRNRVEREEQNGGGPHGSGRSPGLNVR